MVSRSYLPCYFFFYVWGSSSFLSFCCCVCDTISSKLILCMTENGWTFNLVPRKSIYASTKEKLIDPNFHDCNLLFSLMLIAWPEKLHLRTNACSLAVLCECSFSNWVICFVFWCIYFIFCGQCSSLDWWCFILHIG